AARGDAPALPSLRLCLAAEPQGGRRVSLRAFAGSAIPTTGGGAPQPRPPRGVSLSRTADGALPPLPAPPAGTDRGSAADGASRGEEAARAVRRRRPSLSIGM